MSYNSKRGMTRSLYTSTVMVFNLVYSISSPLLVDIDEEDEIVDVDDVDKIISLELADDEEEIEVLCVTVTFIFKEKSSSTTFFSEISTR